MFVTFQFGNKKWMKYICFCILLIAVATWIVYLLLPTTGIKPRHESHSQVEATNNTQVSPLIDANIKPPHLYHEYEKRQEQVSSTCERYSINYFRTRWKQSSNRINNRPTYCSPHACPVYVHDKLRLYYCLIPKVASTAIKDFLFNITEMPHNFTAKTNAVDFHKEANELMKRISPNLYPPHVLRRYYKVMFVRHPFDRLVSAFRDKAERDKGETKYFYDLYWDQMMQKYRPAEKPQPNWKPTFQEFVRYLIETNPSEYDDHWAFYWKRCESCLVQYDMIGKLETAHEDFKQVSNQLQVDYFPDETSPSKIAATRLLSREYFYNLTAYQVAKLHNIYILDFQMFNYTLEEFFGTNNYNRTLKLSDNIK